VPGEERIREPDPHLLEGWEVYVETIFYNDSGRFIGSKHTWWPETPAEVLYAFMDNQYVADIAHECLPYGICADIYASRIEGRICKCPLPVRRAPGPPGTCACGANYGSSTSATPSRN
jgi:hypothetical protein